MGGPLRKRINLLTNSSKLLTMAVFSVLFMGVFSAAPVSASPDWFIDPARYHISAHGQMECLECHEEVADDENHPDPAKVTRGLRADFEADRCFMCHDSTMEDLENGGHGDKSGVDRDLYLNCVLCHDPHYVSRQGGNKIGKFEPGKPKETQCAACHDNQETLPEPAEDDLECLKCHQPKASEEQTLDQARSQICQECHFEKDGQGESGPPLIDPKAFSETIHSQESCLACHPSAAGYNHDRQKPGDCLQCHTRHGEGTAHDAHLIVSCQACHLPGAVVPVRDFGTKTIGWSLIKADQGPSRAHQFLKTDDEETCTRCHFPDNRVGAAAMVLPQKSLICLPCHSASFTAKDTVSIISLLIFLIGLISVAGFWLGGTISGPGSKIGRVAGAVFRTIFSARILTVLKALVLDGLLQRRLYDYSKVRWIIHGLIFFPFVFRFLWGIAGLILTSWWPECELGFVLVDKNHPLTGLLFDLSGLSILVGAGAAVARRTLAGQTEGIKNLPSQDRLALALLGGIVVIGFILEGIRIAMTSAPGGAQYAFAGYIISLFLKGLPGLTEAYGYLWYVHAILTGVFVAYLPFSRMLHILTGPVAAALAALEEEEHGSR